MSIRRFDIQPLLPLLEAGYTVLTPNNRSVDAILREYASTMRGAGESAQSWERPAAFAIDIYIQQLWQRAASLGLSPFNTTQLLGRFDEQEIWLNIVRSSVDAYPLLNSEETASAAARSYRLYQQWDVAASGETERFANAIDFQTFLDWSKQFEKRCTQLKAVSLSDASRTIVMHIAELAAILPSKIALINFNQPPPLYEELFSALGSIATVQWQRAVPTDRTLVTSYEGSESVTRRFQSDLAEIDACIDWCQEKAGRFPEAHIGIVVDHSHSLEPLIEETLFKKTRAGNEQRFSLGAHLNRYHSSDTLFETPDFNAALSLLALNHELVDSERFCKILQSPTLPGSNSEAQARIALELRLRGNIEAQVRLSHLRAAMVHEGRDYHCPLLAQTLLEFTELARHEPGQQSLRQWLQLFGRQLQLLGWQANDASAHSRRQLLLWQQCTRRLAASSGLLGKMPLVVALGKLQTFLKQSNVNLDFDDRLQISLLDAEEAQDLQFDYLWVLSADDRNYPRPINPAAFLPYSLQQALAMPDSSNQQQLDTALTQLMTLRENTRADMVISHHCMEEELSIRSSALLKGIAAEPDAAVNGIQANSTAGRLEKFEDSLHFPLQGDEAVSGGTSLLSNQSNCPFRAFARNRLKASALEEFPHGLNSLVRGNALHKALEHLGPQLNSSATLKNLPASKTERLLTESAAIAIDYLRRMYPETMTPAFSLLEQGRLIKLLQGFLEIEKQRGDFQILHNEKKVSWQHSRLSLNLRVDRIDQLSDGSLALIDFKTGKTSNYRWLDERPDDMQLPLYQIAVSDEQDQTVGAALIFQLNAQSSGLISPLELASVGGELKVNRDARNYEGGWPALQSFWNEIIYKLVQEFEAGLVAVAPTRGYATCQYCELSPLCRIAEAESDEMDLDEAEI